MAEDLRQLAEDIRKLPPVGKLELAANILRISTDEGHRAIATSAVRLALEELELEALRGRR